MRPRRVSRPSPTRKGRVTRQNGKISRAKPRTRAEPTPPPPASSKRRVPREPTPVLEVLPPRRRPRTVVRDEEDTVRPPPEFCPLDLEATCPTIKELITKSSKNHVLTRLEMITLQQDLEHIMSFANDQYTRATGEVAFLTTGDYPTMDLSNRPAAVYENRFVPDQDDYTYTLENIEEWMDPSPGNGFPIDRVNDDLEVWPPHHLPTRFWKIVFEYFLKPVDKAFLAEFKETFVDEFLSEEFNSLYINEPWKHLGRPKEKIKKQKRKGGSLSVEDLLNPNLLLKRIKPEYRDQVYFHISNIIDVACKEARMPERPAKEPPPTPIQLEKKVKLSSPSIIRPRQPVKIKISVKKEDIVEIIDSMMQFNDHQKFFEMVSEEIASWEERQSSQSQSVVVKCELEDDSEYCAAAWFTRSPKKELSPELDAEPSTSSRKSPVKTNEKPSSPARESPTRRGGLRSPKAIKLEPLDEDEIETPPVISIPEPIHNTRSHRLLNGKSKPVQERHFPSGKKDFSPTSKKDYFSIISPSNSRKRSFSPPPSPKLISPPIPVKTKEPRYTPDNPPPKGSTRTVKTTNVSFEAFLKNTVIPSYYELKKELGIDEPSTSYQKQNGKKANIYKEAPFDPKVDNPSMWVRHLKARREASEPPKPLPPPPKKIDYAGQMAKFIKKVMKRETTLTKNGELQKSKLISNDHSPIIDNCAPIVAQANHLHPVAESSEKKKMNGINGHKCHQINGKSPSPPKKTKAKSPEKVVKKSSEKTKKVPERLPEKEIKKIKKKLDMNGTVTIVINGEYHPIEPEFKVPLYRPKRGVPAPRLPSPPPKTTVNNHKKQNGKMTKKEEEEEESRDSAMEALLIMANTNGYAAPVPLPSPPVIPPTVAKSKPKPPSQMKVKVKAKQLAKQEQKTKSKAIKTKALPPPPKKKKVTINVEPIVKMASEGMKMDKNEQVFGVNLPPYIYLSESSDSPLAPNGYFESMNDVTVYTRDEEITQLVSVKILEKLVAHKKLTGNSLTTLHYLMGHDTNMYVSEIGKYSTDSDELDEVSTELMNLQISLKELEPDLKGVMEHAYKKLFRDYCYWESQRLLDESENILFRLADNCYREFPKRFPKPEEFKALKEAWRNRNICAKRHYGKDYPRYGVAVVAGAKKVDDPSLVEELL